MVGPTSFTAPVRAANPFNTCPTVPNVVWLLMTLFRIPSRISSTASVASSEAPIASAAIFAAVIASAPISAASNVPLTLSRSTPASPVAVTSNVRPAVVGARRLLIAASMLAPAKVVASLIIESRISLTASVASSAAPIASVAMAAASIAPAAKVAAAIDPSANDRPRPAAGITT